jgi:hypothetical protein
MATINFPTGINGVTEVGIAAGVDAFTDAAYGITVRMQRTATAPAIPSPVQIRAASVVREWGALTDGNARAVYWSTPGSVIGTSALSDVDIKAEIDDWPANDADARSQDTIAAAVATTTVTEYDAWILIPADEREHLVPDLSATMVSSTPPGANAVAQRLWQGLVAYAVSNGWIVKHQAASSGLIVYVGPEVAPAAGRDVGAINAIGFHPAQESANLLVALKITWWLINHHVGQDEGKVEGFVGKIAVLQGLISSTNATQNREVRNVLWALGKMISTRGILSAIGIQGITYADNSNTGQPSGNDYARGEPLAIGISADVLLRVQSEPAGTASISTYFAIATRAINSVFSVCVPPFQSLGWDSANDTYTGRVHNSLQAIRAAPASYHMGAVFLTGNARVIADGWQEEEMSTLSAFIHASASGSTLARAPVILKPTEVVGNITYNLISTIRTQLANAIGGRINLALINQMSGGGAVGGVARQFGRLTDVQVQDAQAQLQMVDQGDVSEDEGPPASGRESAPARIARESRNTTRASRRSARANAGALVVHGGAVQAP